MPRKFTALFFLGLMVISALSMLTSCAVVVRRPPRPAAHIEVLPARPRPQAVWIQGHWAWRSRPHRWVWVPGHWARRRR